MSSTSCAEPSNGSEPDLVFHLGGIEPKLRLEKLGCNLPDGRAVAIETVVGLLLEASNQIRDGVDANVGRNHQDERKLRKRRDRREVLDRVVVQFLVEERPGNQNGLAGAMKIV